MSIRHRLATVLATASLFVVPAMTSAPAHAATGVCSGQRYCTVKNYIDVDGDGRRDQVGLVDWVYSDGSEGGAQVRVRTAKGKLLTTSHKTWWNGDGTWHGAAKIDGRAGYELVLATDMGAHMLGYRVVTYRDGRLVTLKAPGNQYTWWIDSSYSFNRGWYRSVKAGKAYLTSKSAVRNESYGHDLRVNRYVWRNGRWVSLSSTRTRHASDRASMTIGGWHVPYLKRFPSA